MKKFLMVVLSISLFAACSQNTNRGGSQAEGQQPAVAATSSSENMKITSPVKFLTEIAEKYSGVKIQAVNQSDNKTFEADIPFGVKTQIAGTDFSMEISSFFTDFSMAQGSVINRSLDEKNPAAKVTIFKGDQMVFNGWLFQNFPDMHSFEDPVWKFFMISGIKNKSDIKSI